MHFTVQPARCCLAPEDVGGKGETPVVIGICV